VRRAACDGAGSGGRRWGAHRRADARRGRPASGAGLGAALLKHLERGEEAVHVAASGRALGVAGLQHVQALADEHELHLHALDLVVLGPEERLLFRPADASADFAAGTTAIALAAAWGVDLASPDTEDAAPATVLEAFLGTLSAEARAWLVGIAGDTSEDSELRKNALFWAGQSGAISAAELQELYGSFDDPEMKEQLIFVASQTREPGAVDFLMEVAREEEDGELREKAIFWLGQSKDPRVAEFLLSLIRR